MNDTFYNMTAKQVTFLVAIREGENDVKQGRVISNEEMKRRLEKICAANDATEPRIPLKAPTGLSSRSTNRATS